ncbi:MAG: NAD(P)H-dependent oxidoreductase [Cyclobacteriaceae bacterium]|nr:NAD(P)H-dependent oxidoreductase [Cyclobacteriaceae bacterium]MCH8516972.1 NAD(P)H-dependent oxidoreductase [Cyclobacteriaceae bacterium]
MISIIVGTNRVPSVSAQLATYYEKQLISKGQEALILHLSNLPDDFTATALYHNNGKNEAFNEHLIPLKKSNKFLFIVPEYNGSFPGVLKAFIDGMSYPNDFKYKKCAITGLASGAQGSALAISHLTDIFNYLGMSVLAQKPRLGFINQNFDGEQFTNPLYQTMVEEQIDQFLKF